MYLQVTVTMTVMAPHQTRQADPCTCQLSGINTATTVDAGCCSMQTSTAAAALQSSPGKAATIDEKNPAMPAKGAQLNGCDSPAGYLCRCTHLGVCQCKYYTSAKSRGFCNAHSQVMYTCGTCGTTSSHAECHSNECITIRVVISLLPRVRAAFSLL
jgi:hypothetical protein